MPGSIQVSVLDFKDLPSSSNSVKLSLGKVEHEAEANGSFSFPLTNLRDNLIITVQDSEGNQVSQSGVRTMSIVEKGIWDDVFPIEGGGLIHMKLQFLLSDEERNRIRLMRESAMKKKQAEIFGSRHEVSGVLSASSSQDFQRSSLNNDISSKASESFDGIKEESFQKEVENVLEKIPDDVKDLEDTKTRDFSNNNNNNNAVKSEPLYNMVEKLDTRIPSFVKKTSKERKFPPLSKETDVNTVKNDGIQLQETNLLKRLQDSSSSDVASSRLSLEKIPQNIKKMISVFESTVSQDRVPLRSVSTQSYRFGTSQLVKDCTSNDYYEKSTNLKNSEDSSSSRLRTSFSTGDLREGLSNIITKGDQVELDNSFVKPNENTQSPHEGVNDENESIDGRKTSKVNLDYFDQDGPGQWTFLDEKRQLCMPAQGDTTISLLSDHKIEEKGQQENMQPPHEGVNSQNQSIDGRKTSKVNLDYFDQDGSGQWMFLDEKRQPCMTAQGDTAISLLSEHKIEEKGEQENIVASIPEIAVKDEDIKSPESADAEASNGTFGQAMKIALVVGFGVLIFLFRPKESRPNRRARRSPRPSR